jgi:anti-sigma B factor antagonist
MVTRPVSDFSLSTTRDAERCRISVTGDLDIQTAPEVESLALQHLGDPTIGAVALNLSEVSFVDSTAIGTLVQLRLAAREQGKQLVLAQLSQRVRDVLEITALTTTFDIEELA